MILPLQNDEINQDSCQFKSDQWYQNHAPVLDDFICAIACLVFDHFWILRACSVGTVSKLIRYLNVLLYPQWQLDEYPALDHAQIYVKYWCEHVIHNSYLQFLMKVIDVVSSSYCTENDDKDVEGEQGPSLILALLDQESIEVVQSDHQFAQEKGRCDVD